MAKFVTQMKKTDGEDVSLAIKLGEDMIAIAKAEEDSWAKEGGNYVNNFGRKPTGNFSYKKTGDRFVCSINIYLNARLI